MTEANHNGESHSWRKCATGNSLVHVILIVPCGHQAAHAGLMSCDDLSLLTGMLGLPEAGN